MAMIASSEKLPGGPEQFYFMAGGYVLLRIARDGGREEFSVMTATADESRPYVPATPRPERPSLFRDADGNPLTKRSPPKPRQEAVHPRAYPDLDKLVEAAREVPALAAGEERRDSWGRPYIVGRGHVSAWKVRSIGNHLARSLGLEEYEEPWAYEEMQDLHDELSVGENGEDAYLFDGMTISSFGDLSGR